MKRLDSRLFKIPDCIDLSIPVTSEDSYEFVALLNKDMFFIYGILFYNLSFFKLSRDAILRLKDDSGSDKIFQNMPYWLTYAVDLTVLKKQGYISYMKFEDFENFKNKNRQLFK